MKTRKNTPYLTARLLILLILIFANSLGWTATYNVNKSNSNASDSNPGNSNQPWRTIQKGAETMAPGDTCIVLEGEYLERIRINNSGSPGSPIVFIAQGTVVNNGFTIEADYIHVIGFEITNTPNDYKDGQGIWLVGKHCEIKNNYLHNITRWGILLYYEGEADDPKTSYNIVKNNRIERACISGIAVWGQYNTIENNDISHSIQHSPNWVPLPEYADADGIRFFGKGHIIRGNYIHDITFDDPENKTPHIDGFQTYGSFPSSDIIIEGNYVDLPKPPSSTSCQFITFSGSPVKNIEIRNNVFVTDATQRCPVNVRGVGSNIAENINIKNNTFIRTGDPSYYVQVISSKNVTVKNNIFYCSGKRTNSSEYIYVMENVSNLSAGSNLIYINEGTIPGSPYTDDLWNVNPEFVNPENADFRLKESSPAIDYGILFPEMTVDFAGNSRPQGSGLDLGAFEFGNEENLPPLPPQNLRIELIDL